MLPHRSSTCLLRRAAALVLLSGWLACVVTPTARAQSVGSEVRDSAAGSTGADAMGRMRRSALGMAGDAIRTAASFLDPRLQITQYVHEAWTAEDGLPQNSISAVVQTPDGYLWVATQDGLARFDGVRFVTFDRSDGLPNNEVRALEVGRDGSLWVGTNGGGLSRYADGRFETFTERDGLPNDHVRALHEDVSGNLWIGTIEGGLARFDGTSFTRYTTDDGLAGNVVLSIEEDPDGSLWIGTQAGLSRYHDGSFQSFGPQDGLPGPLVWALETSRDGLWIGTSGGLARIQNGRMEQEPVAASACAYAVGAIYEDSSGALWIGTFGGGICRLYDGRIERFSVEEGLTNERIRAVMPDREGSLWIGTESGGLNRFRQGKFTHVTTAEGLAGDMAYTVLEDRSGRIWVGTKSSGLTRLDGRDIQQYSTTNGLPRDQIYALAEGSGGIWVGLYGGGICRLSEGRRVCYGTADGLQSANVYAVAEDARGTVWIGTEAGLATLRDGRIVPFDGDEALARAPITAILADRSGRIWIGAYGSGLSRVSDGEVIRHDQANGFVDANVLMLHEDDAGAIWAGTHGAGLCRITDESTGCLTSSNGLPSDNVLQVVTDGVGGLWLGTMQDIVRLRLDAARAVLEGRQGALEVMEYGRGDGLKSTEINGGTQPPAWRSRDGRLWFATNHGVAVIDPVHVRTNPVPPPVAIEELEVNGELLPTAGAVTLPPGSRDLTFRYTGLSFVAPRAVRFQFRLDGYDERWIDAGTRREAYYTNLPPGTYTFRVRAANNDGVWNEAGAALAFELEPFFYQTTWFTILCVLGALAGAFGAYRLRIRQLKARERMLERVVDERTRDLRLEKEKTEASKRVIEAQAEKLRELDRFKTQFFANVSHEFRTPLTMIIGPLENMLAGLYEPVTGKVRQQTEIMLRNAMRLMRLINQLLDLSKLEDGKMTLRARTRNIVPFLEGIVLSCTAFAERKGIELSFSSAIEELTMWYEPDKLEKVFFNLLSNATKFTPSGGRISMHVSREEPSESFPDGAVQVRVKDTGKGIPEDQLEVIFDRFHQVDGSNTREHEGTGIGLSLAKELVHLHRGSIFVESEVGKGTEFVVDLPLGTAHLTPDECVEEAVEEIGPAHGGAMSELVASDLDYMHEDDPPAEPARRAGVDAPLLLVVDDNKDVREYVEGLLCADYRIVTAKDGSEGLEAAQRERPDLILSDVMMPVMDGNELCRRVKTSDDLKHIPVILVTARATHELKIEGLEVGADDYIPKPFNVNELRLRIRNLLRLRRQEKELKELNDHLEQKVQEQFDILVRERMRYEEDLIQAKEKAEASDRLKTAILNNLSHEFRTPLTAIMGFNEILAQEAPANLAEFTHEIDRGSRRLLRTLDSLLELSRLEAEAVGTNQELVDVSIAARAVVGRIRARANEKGLAIHFESEGPAEVRLDASAIHEILDNLLDNAVKFTKDGEITVHVGREDGAAVVRIQDTGTGIGREFLPHIYDAFKQESEGYTRAFEGVGLGLTVTKRLVELLGGEIEVESEKEKGSVFTVRLPESAHAEAAVDPR